MSHTGVHTHPLRRHSEGGSDLPPVNLTNEIGSGDTAGRPPYPIAGDIYIDTEANITYICYDDGTWTNITSGLAGSHVLLDGGTIHTDTVADGVTRGSLIYGNATPKWDELVVGTTGQYLGTDGTDAMWRSQSTLDHGSIGGLTDDDHTQYLLANGTRALSADWDAGSFEIRAQTFESDVATGTAPLVVASTTKVTNLNSDLLDDQTGSYYLDSDNFTGTEWTDLTDGGATTLHSHSGGSGHTIRENGSDQTTRAALNFVDTLAGTGLITDDAGNDETEVNTSLYVLADGARAITSALKQVEIAAAPADVAGQGQWWTKDNNPSQPMYTGDDGYDYALGNQWHALTLSDASVHATTKKAATPFWGGPASQATNNWICKAFAIDAVSETNTFEVYRIRAGSASLIATITITSTNRIGSASSAFTLQDDDMLYVLHTGGGTSGTIYSIGFKRQ